MRLGNFLNMASRASTSLLDGISKEECTLLAQSFKDKKFRQLLCDYAKEVNDPENRKQFEQEVIEYEKERGVEAVFVHPSPGFALALRGGGDPGFVNICSSDVVQKPDLQPVINGGSKCHKWSLPHVVPKPRREVLADREEAAHDLKQVVVYDVVFHLDALQLALQSPVIKQSLIDTAVDSLRKHFSVKIGKVEEVDKKYIGMPARSIIKSKMNEKHSQADEEKSANKDHRTNMIDDKVVNVSEDNEVNEKSKFIEPKYKLKYVRKMDIQDYSVQLIPQCSLPWQPQALELEVNLAGVSRASQVNADIQQQCVLLTTESNPKYKLELPLRYPVDEDRSTAKFDVSTQKLTLSLTVVPSNKNSEKLSSHGQSPPSDSGIECEFDYRTNGDSDNVSEESVSSQDDGAKDVEGVAGGEEEDNVFESPSTEHNLMLAPNYFVKQTKESLYIFLCCGNVHPSSIKIEQVDDMNAGIELSSIGGGQTLLHYSLKVDVTPHKIAASGLTHKEEEGKVVLMLKKAMVDLWDTCKIGHLDSMTTVNLSTTDDEEKQSSGLSIEKQDNPKSCTCVSRTPRMARTVSMCETEAGHPFRLRGPTCSWPRGILKHRVRSLSESQVGTFSSAPIEPTSSSFDLEVFEHKQRYGDDEEEEESVEESVASSLGEKKSVRFNEVVSRQLFRSNSSILGQRAKNQRKAIRKRKSQARRESESEKDTEINTSESTSGDSDLTTDAATDDDTEGTNSNTTEMDDNVDVDNDPTNSENNNNINNNGGVLQPLKTGRKNDNVYKLTRNNNNNNNNNSDDNSNNNSGNGALIDENANKEEDDNNDFIIKTSKKKKRKNRKNKLPSFEPTNNLIFQLDMDK